MSADYNPMCHQADVCASVPELAKIFGHSFGGHWALNALLENTEVRTHAELATMSDGQLLAVDNFGYAALERVRRRLAAPNYVPPPPCVNKNCVEWSELASFFAHDTSGHRALNALVGAGVRTVEDVSARSDGDLMTIKHIGPTRVRALRSFAPHQDTNTVYAVEERYIFTGMTKILANYSREARAVGAMGRYLERMYPDQTEVFHGTRQEMMDQHSTERFRDDRVLITADGTRAVTGRLAYEVVERELDKEIEL